MSYDPCAGRIDKMDGAFYSMAPIHHLWCLKRMQHTL